MRIALLISLVGLLLGTSLPVAYAGEHSSDPGATKQSAEASPSVSATLPTETGSITVPPKSALPAKKAETPQPWCPAARRIGSGTGFCLIN